MADERRRVKLEAINSTAVLLQWRPPSGNRKPLGVVSGYRIYYVQLRRPDDEDIIVFDVPDGLRTECVIADLEADTAYQFQIAGYNRNGEGAMTTPKTIKTRGAGGYHCEIT